MLSVFAKKLTSLFLMAIVLAVSALSLCPETDATEQSRAAYRQAACEASSESAADHCPACPGGGHADEDQCASSCYCSCHLPVPEQSPMIGHSSIVADLIHFERFTALPEVYLPKFIPPQNRA